MLVHRALLQGDSYSCTAQTERSGIELYRSCCSTSCHLGCSAEWRPLRDMTARCCTLFFSWLTVSESQIAVVPWAQPLQLFYV